MLTATAQTARTLPLVEAVLRFARVFDMAVRHARLFEMTDGQLAARGLDRSKLGALFLKDLRKI